MTKEVMGEMMKWIFRIVVVLAFVAMWIITILKE